MPTYAQQLADETKFKGNVVIRFGGRYFSVREPDSGLSIPKEQQRVISSLVINQTTIDPKRVSTTIGSYSFSLADRHGIVSRIVKDTGVDVIGASLEMWIGRAGVSMAFSDYYQMPTTKISKCQKIDGGWAFTTKESTNRMNRTIFATKSRLSGDIVSGTSIISAKDSIASFPSSGFFRLDREIISYTSKDNTLKTFYGCARGEFTTQAVEHEDNVSLQLAETVTANPVDIILQLLTSGSGSGDYDLLVDGLAIDPSLIDIAEIEALRDSVFADVEFSLALYEIPNALQYIEENLLAPCNLRFTFSRNSLLTLVKLNTAAFVAQVDVLDHDTMVGAPALVVDDTKIINRVNIQWDYNEGTGQYAHADTYDDDDSIAAYGLCTSPLSFSIKGTDDQDFVDAFADEILERFSTPKPEVEVRAFISKSMLNVGEIGRVETTRLPNALGELNFASDMEIVSRAINYQTGDVKLKLVYTGFTDVRLGFIAPSDTIAVVTSQTVAEFAAGRADRWMAGWKVRLWNIAGQAYESDAVNTIESIDGDEITFADAWATTLTTGHKIKFCDYDDAIESQKRYAFVGIQGSDFSVTEKSYKIVP